MHDVLRFWCERGVDGFRIDVVHKLAKDPNLRDATPGEPTPYEDWRPQIHERLRRLRKVVDDYPDRMLVGEVYLLDLERVVAYVNSGDELHLAHNFVFLKLPWDAAAFRGAIDGFQALSSKVSWPAWFLSNHDNARVASRFDDDGHGAARARAVLLILYALRGTPFIYQGEELGLPDADIPPDRVVDVDGRDPERAPLPWLPPSEAGPGAGFTTGEPWLPLHAYAETLNVAVQDAAPASTLNLTRRLAALRADTPSLQTGPRIPLDAGPDVLAWRRDPEIVAAVNFAAAPRRLPAGDGAELLLSSDPARSAGARTDPRPAEAVLLRIVPAS